MTRKSQFWKKQKQQLKNCRQSKKHKTGKKQASKKTPTGFDRRNRQKQKACLCLDKCTCRKQEGQERPAWEAAGNRPGAWGLGPRGEPGAWGLEPGARGPRGGGYQGAWSQGAKGQGAQRARRPEGQGSLEPGNLEPGSLEPGARGPRGPGGPGAWSLEPRAQRLENLEGDPWRAVGLKGDIREYWGFRPQYSAIASLAGPSP